MKGIVRHIALIRGACGGLLILAGIVAAYWWFYKLVPVRRLGDPRWCAEHSARARWGEEQKKYERLSASPDLCFAGDMIGYYGDKRWCLWLVEKMRGGGGFRVCGCTETALALMANRHEQSWADWASGHRDETQEEWIRDGFAQRGIAVHLPPQPEDALPLLEVLGRARWLALRGGARASGAPEEFPEYLQYNAFRWVRDSGFDQTAFAVSNAPALGSDVVRVGLMEYTKWGAAFPRRAGAGILAFGGDRDDDDAFWGTSPIARPGFQCLAWLIVFGPMAAGGALLLWKRMGIGERVGRGVRGVMLPFAAAGQWARKHRRAALSAGLLVGCLGVAITYVMLPVWLPDWVIGHSSSPERVLRATHHASNGHSEAAPALKRLLGDDFDDFLLRKLAGSDAAAKEEAACILAYSNDPAAEGALIEAYLRGGGEDLQRSLLFYLGWTATEHSREFLTGILDRRIEGPRWSALRSLSWSSIRDRYEIIARYLSDPDGEVREEAEDAFRRKLEEEFEGKIEAMAKSDLFPLAKRLAEAHQGVVPPAELPREVAGRKVLWGRIQGGCLDLRFDDDKTGILINAEGQRSFPAINRYFIGGGRTEGISPYTVF